MGEEKLEEKVKSAFQTIKKHGKEILHHPFTPAILAGTTIIAAAIASNYKDKEIQKVKNEKTAAEIESSEKDSLLSLAQDSIESLEEKTENLEGQLETVKISRVEREGLPESLDEFNSLFEEYPQLKPIAESIIEQGSKLEDQGHHVFSLISYLGRVMQESDGQNLYTEVNGRLQMTHDKEKIKRYWISQVGAGGPVQVMPHIASELGLEVLNHPSWEKAWDMNDEVRNARNNERQALQDIHDYLNRFDFEKIPENASGKRDSLMHALKEASSDQDSTEAIKSITEMHGGRLFQLVSNYLLAKSKHDSLKSLQDSLYTKYENLLADSVAGKTVEEIKRIDERMTLNGAAEALIKYDSRDFRRHLGDPVIRAALYYSGRDNILWGPNPDYGFEERIERMRLMQAIFGEKLNRLSVVPLIESESPIKSSAVSASER